MMNCPTCNQEIPPSEELLITDYSAHWRGHSVEISRTEAKVLSHIKFNKRVTYQQLCMEMYGREDIDHNAIAVHISRLRPKLATISILIDMKKTFGYMLQEAA